MEGWREVGREGGRDGGRDGGKEEREGGPGVVSVSDSRTQVL